MVWSVAGSDSGGGAGLQADLKALQAFGVHGCTAVAAITAQHSTAVTRIEAVRPELLEAQLAALADDLPPQAIKTGLLGSVDNLRLLCRWVDRLRAQWGPLPLVVDPVLRASSGAAFADAALLNAYRDELLPRASLITPNRAEARRLGLGGERGAPLACAAPAWVVTGGDAEARDAWPQLASDRFHSPQAQGWLSLPRLATPHHHGTGCSFAASAAAALASGYCEADAIVLAKMATTQALRLAYAAGRGAGPVQPGANFSQHAANLPWLQAQPGLLPGRQPGANPGAPPGPRAGFAPLLNPVLGVYAVVDSAEGVAQVLAAGVRTVQLRIKQAARPDLADQVARSVALAAQVPGTQLFINDHWRLALQCGAYGVHLGQEDLAEADLAALQSAGLRLGISTHSYWEMARAWALQPSYLAVGPVFATRSKDMPWRPQGLDNLRYWARLLPLPVVGIAGIDGPRMTEVAATGAAGAAVITAISRAADPAQACRDLMAAWQRGRTCVEPGLRQMLADAGACPGQSVTMRGH